MDALAQPDAPPAAVLSVESQGPSGREVVLIWTWLNESGLEQAIAVPESIEVFISAGGREHRLWGRLLPPDAAARAGRVTLGPGQFRRARYSVELPPGVAGATVFRTSTGSHSLSVHADRPLAADSGAGVSAVAAGPVPVPVPDGEGGAGARPARTTPVPLPLTDRLGSAISAHEPVYIAFGDRQRRNARFQISFKYRFFNEEGDLARELAPLRHLYFGYTQTALWDLESDSAPFRDSSYRPSLFYRNDALWTSAAKAVRLGVATGLEHESNGRDGVSSRSINTAFVRPLLRLGDPAGWHLTLGPRLHAYLDRTGNADIARYRGHADLFASIGHPARWQFAATVRRGTDSSFGSTLVEASYPLRTVSLGNLDGYVYFQYFDGYGESVLDYNRKFPAQFRIGFAITRWP
jgi:outer membrane phospholipase A